MWDLLLVCTAGPLGTGQEILTYLFFNILPIFIIILLHLAYPTKTLATAITKSVPWRPLQGKPHHLPHKNQKMQDSCEKSSSQKQDKWSNHANFPFSGALCRLQGWLLCRSFSLTLLWSAHLGSILPGLQEQGDAPTCVPAGQI